MRNLVGLTGLVLGGMCPVAVLEAQGGPIVEGEDQGWIVDVSAFIFGAGMDGTIGVAGHDADIDVSFGDIIEDLEMGAMGSVRVARNRWAFTTEVIYMGLGASAGAFGTDVDQWNIEPSASFRVSDRFETIVGARYTNLSTEIRGPFGRAVSGTVDWWDPIIGARLMLPIKDGAWTFNLRGDVGGFGVGSDFAWQLFPYLSWQFGERGSMQAGYRAVSMDYDEGSGLTEFKYDVVTQGPQLGVTFRF
jgi:hypothetical protein